MFLFLPENHLSSLSPSFKENQEVILNEKRVFNKELRRDSRELLPGGATYTLLPGAITNPGAYAAWCSLPRHVLSATAQPPVGAAVSGEATGVGSVTIFFLCFLLWKRILETASFRQKQWF